MCISHCHSPFLVSSTLFSIQISATFLIADLVLDAVPVQWGEMRHEVAAAVSCMVAAVHMLS